ncbi:MAG TPA: hypothetical protein VF035_07160, partial [Longimicrobiales bacterium]
TWLRDAGLGDRVSLDSIQNLLGREGAQRGAAAVPADALPVLREGLSRGLHVVFWGIALFGFITFLISWQIPELEREA